MNFPRIKLTLVVGKLCKYKNIFRYILNTENKPIWFVIREPLECQEPIITSLLLNHTLQHQNVNPVLQSSEELLIELEEDITWNNKLGLYPWQIRALNSWKKAEYIGVVEAVTGGGKTRLAIGAIEAHLKHGWKVAVLVHTKELLYQWHRVIQEIVNVKLHNHYEIGFLGDGDQSDLDDCDILIAVAASASENYMLPEDLKGLLIVDECHHYGSEKWQKCLEPNFERRLGLTATYEREDDRMEALDAYFNEIVYELDFDEAIEDEIIAGFKIAFLGVDFDEDEQEEYDKQDAICRKLRNKLIKELGLDEEPFSTFMSQVNQLAKSGFNEESRIAGQYRVALNRRKDIISNARQKVHALHLLVEAIENSHRAILFSQTIDTAKKAVNIL
jgi:superfamily II DNA or RNA helicase